MRISPVWDFVKSPPPHTHTQSLIKLTVTSRWSHSAFAPHFQSCCLSFTPSPRAAASLIVTKTLALFAQTSLSFSTASLRPLTAFIHPWPSDTSHCSHTWGANLLLPDSLHALSKLKTSRGISHMPLFKSSGKQKGEQKFIVCLKWCFSYHLQQTFLK